METNMEPNRTPVKPDNYLVWAILSTVLCCLPFGIVAIINATGVDSAWALGNYEEAMAKSKKAANWSLWSAIAGIVVSAIYFFIAVLGALL